VDRLRSIEVFVAAVEQGSFSQAARQMDMTPAMVGKHVRQLEAELGARLLQRSTRRQSLTDAGRRFYAEGKKVLEQLAWARASVEGLRQQPSGRLRITAPTTLGACVVAPLAADYQQAHPQVGIELDLSNGVADLVEEGFDLAVRIGEPDPRADLVARRLGDYCMVICASPSYLKRHGVPRTPADLSAHLCLGHMVWTPRTAWQLQGPQGPMPWPGEAPFLCNDGQALRQAALRGAGLLLQPRVLLKDDLRRGRLRAVLESCLPAARPVYLLYRQDRHLLPKTRSFIDFIRKAFSSA